MCDGRLPCVVPSEKAPEWLQRPYIKGGYIVGGTPVSATRATLFGWNNETLNAHTMLWAALLSTYLYSVVRAQLPNSFIPFTLFWLSCVVHVPFSVGLHCTIGVSAEQRSTWRTLDIGFIFTCSVVLAAALGWYVFPTHLQYGLFLAATLGVYGMVVYNTMVVRRMRDIPKKQTARYVACVVLTYAVPLLFAAGQEVWELGVAGPVARQVALIAAVLLVGGELYSRHYPERLLPGRFDLILNSHQLMHLLAMVAHYLEWQLLRHMALQAGEGPAGTGGVEWPAKHTYT